MLPLPGCGLNPECKWEESPGHNQEKDSEVGHNIYREGFLTPAFRHDLSFKACYNELFSFFLGKKTIK